MTVLERVALIFAGAEEAAAPAVEDRYEYKKRSGSSDGQNTADEFE